jgi:histidine phosphotransferase ChpT
MTQDQNSLAMLIGSRICHDLISPVGAIQNGIELLEMAGQRSPELSLIQESAANASARIRFMRIAFGLAGEQSIGEAEILTVLDDMGRAGRVRYEWAGGADCPRTTLQAVFLAFLCLESAMPRGGTIRAEQTGADWVVSGPADMTRPDPALWALLGGTEPEVSALPAQVQFPLLVSLLQARGTRAEVTAEGETVAIRFAA